MTNEELQKTMEFIIKQQESFSEHMEQLRESHAKGEARLTRLESAFVNLYNTVTEIGKAQKDLTEKVGELAESQAHTDQKLNVLIDILNEGRNGKSQS
jgi:predicted  nucleic acid-binding Zn-ribbon protein